MSGLQAVILAGGEGTRLRPLTYTTPKPLLPICNVPFLEHQLTLMQRHGVNDAILLTGYLADQFQPFADRMQRERGIRLVISKEEEPLGTCGAVRSVRDRLTATTIVFNGDVLTDLDLGALIASHQQRGAALSLTLKPVDDAGPYGLVPLDADDRVLEFLEKPPPEIAAAGGLINAGTYALEPHTLDQVPANTAWSFERQLFPSLVAQNAGVWGFVSDAYWLDIGTPERYLQAHWDLIGGASLYQPPGREHPRRVFVAETSTMHAVTTDECVLVGEGCVIADGAKIGPRASLGAGVRVDEGAFVRDSVLMDGVHVHRNARVEGSIVGAHAVIRSETTITGGIVAAGDR